MTAEQTPPIETPEPPKGDPIPPDRRTPLEVPDDSGTPKPDDAEEAAEEEGGTA